MERFSGAVKIGDLNDFIAPSQACVISLDGKQVPPPTAPKAEVPGFQQTVTAGDTNAIKVSLQDCLACSGCVTSAETVLLQHQSTEELSLKLNDHNVVVIATLSSQSRAALAAEYGMGVKECSQRLVGFLKGIGVRYVLDAHPPRSIALEETAADFISRLGPVHPDRMAPDTASGPQPADGRASAQQSSGVHRQTAVSISNGRQQAAAEQTTEARGRLPMLTSACPGWVCYAEKTHGSYILPYICSAKSPQAVAGTLVKRVFCKQHGIDPCSVYHVAIMPCYDKKLEASRTDFTYMSESQEATVTETDSVLATTEIHQLLQAASIDLAQQPSACMDSWLGTKPGDDRLKGVRGGSGGYLEYSVKRAARELYGVDLGSGPLAMRTLKNSDMQEFHLEVGGQRVLSAALAYGFRHIQNLTRKIKGHNCPYDIVEIMACPSGCLNGGGQVKVEGGQQAVHARLRQLEDVYHSRKDVQLQWPEDDAEAQLLREALASAGHKIPDLLHTEYHHREKSVQTALLDW